MFEDELTELANSIRAEVLKRKASDQITKSRFVRVRRRDFSLSCGVSEVENFEPTRIEEETWDFSDERHFQDSFVKGLEQYKSLVSALEAGSNLIDRFAHAISFASFHGLDDNDLKDRVIALGHEIDGQPLPVKITAYISGLTIAESPIIISDGFVLRQPTSADMTEEVIMDEYGGFSFPQSHTFFNVVGDFIFDAISTGNAQREFLRTLDALRLFRVAGIVAGRYVMSSRHSFLQGAKGILGEPQRFSRSVCTLSRSDAALIKDFLTDVVPLLPDPFHVDESITEREIAYVRYRDALFQQRPSERAITLAITALEALLLEGKSELQHRLSQRVSLFLRILGTQLDSRVTYENVKSGYDIRSTFVHGYSVKPKYRPQVDSLMPTLLGYARECVLAFLQMKTSKGELLEQLDRAMIDPAGVRELESSFATVVHR